MVAGSSMVSGQTVRGWGGKRATGAATSLPAAAARGLAEPPPVCRRQRPVVWRSRHRLVQLGRGILGDFGAGRTPQPCCPPCPVKLLPSGLRRPRIMHPGKPTRRLDTRRCDLNRNSTTWVQRPRRGLGPHDPPSAGANVALPATDLPQFAGEGRRRRHRRHQPLALHLRTATLHRQPSKARHERPDRSMDPSQLATANRSSHTRAAKRR